MRDRNLQIAAEPLRKVQPRSAPGALVSTDPIDLMDGTGELLNWSPSAEELEKLKSLTDHDGWEIHQKLISQSQWSQLLRISRSIKHEFDQGVYAGIKLSRKIVGTALSPKEPVAEQDEAPELPNRYGNNPLDF